MPQLLAQTPPPAGGWGKWRPTQAPIPELWAGDTGRFWARNALQRPADQARTARLAVVDLPLTFPGGINWAGCVYGQPVDQVPANYPKAVVTDSSQSWWPFWDWYQRAAIPMPLPEVIHLEADPTAPFDRHWRCIEGAQALWEAWVFRAGGIFGAWSCSGWARWNLSVPWNAPGQPLGVVAAKVPSTPLLLRWEEIQRRDVSHALFLALPGYAPEKVGPARGTDGRLTGHPVRAGEWLRLKPAVVDRIVVADGIEHPRSTVALALGSKGAYVCDTNHGTSGAFNMTQDARFVDGDGTLPPLGDLGLRLSDFEVVAQ